MKKKKKKSKIKEIKKNEIIPCINNLNYENNDKIIDLQISPINDK